MKFIEKLQRFMMGRYGSDKLNRFLLVSALVFMGAGFVFTLAGLPIPSIICSLAETGLIVLVFYRTLSRKVYVRAAENAKFLRVYGKISSFFKKPWGQVRGFVNLRHAMWRDRKTHVFKKCPHCKSILRLPRKKGHHTVKCIRCAHRFEVDVK